VKKKNPAPGLIQNMIEQSRKVIFAHSRPGKDRASEGNALSINLYKIKIRENTHPALSAYEFMTTEV